MKEWSGKERMASECILIKEGIKKNKKKTSKNQSSLRKTEKEIFVE